MAGPGRVRVGIGGWSFPPWRGSFYPPGLPHARELEHAASQLTSIEINATFHRTQSPASFAAWRDAVPDGFVFSVKGPRAVTWRSALAEAGDSIARFLNSGVTELGDRLGVILWQLQPNRAFDPDSIGAFLDLLPPTHAGRKLRHAVEAHHPSFADPAFAALLRQHRVAWAIVDDDGFPEADSTAAPHVYARLKRNSLAAAEGYDSAALDAWAETFRALARAGQDCFIYCIAGDKVRAPEAARALIRRVSDTPETT